MIIRSAGIYASTFFSSVPKLVANTDDYYNSIKPIYRILEKNFPLLKMVVLPTKEPHTAFIQGILLPSYAISEMSLLPEQYKDFGLPIFANIPEDFQTNGLEVYDSCNRIDWDQIPYEFKHCHYPTDEEQKYGLRKICTHKPEFITSQNCVLNVLLNAYYLFQEYKRYDNKGVFELECLPHGEAINSKEGNFGKRRKR